jgi:hypothetical protein
MTTKAISFFRKYCCGLFSSSPPSQWNTKVGTNYANQWPRRMQIFIGRCSLTIRNFPHGYWRKSRFATKCLRQSLHHFAFHFAERHRHPNGQDCLQLQILTNMLFSDLIAYHFDNFEHCAFARLRRRLHKTPAELRALLAPWHYRIFPLKMITWYKSSHYSGNYVPKN